MDIFSYSEERRQERQDIVAYVLLVGELIANLDKENYPHAVALAELPAELRGFGHVKDRNREKVALQRAPLLAKFRNEQLESAVKIIEAA